jgi:hypothetical protein
MKNRQWEEKESFWEYRVSRRITKKAANMIRRTRSDAGGHSCQCQSSGQRASETLGFEGLTSGKTPLHWCSTHRTFRSRLMQTLCRYTASDFVSCFTQILCPMKHRENLLSKTACLCWLSSLLALCTNMVMLNALRIVNIFPSPMSPMNYCNGSLCPPMESYVEAYVPDMASVFLKSNPPVKWGYLLKSNQTSESQGLTRLCPL